MTAPHPVGTVTETGAVVVADGIVMHRAPPADEASGFARGAAAMQAAILHAARIDPVSKRAQALIAEARLPGEAP